MSNHSKLKGRRFKNNTRRLGLEVLENRMLLAAGPEIDVQFGAETLPIGGSVDFGSVLAGDAGRTRTFTVINRGNQPLTLGNISLPDGFRVKEGLNSTIRAHGRDNFTIEMITSEPGFKAGNLQFTNNDANENPYEFTIAGEVAPRRSGEPDLEVVLISRNMDTVWSGSTIDFGTAHQHGAVPPKTFRVLNRGDRPLNLGTLEVPAGFRVLGRLSQTIAPGRSDFFTIVMRTGTAGFLSGTVRFTSNAVDEESFEFTVQGEVAQRGQPEADVLLGETAVRSGTVVDFGSATKDDSPRERTFTVVNKGTRTLNLAALQVPDGFRVKEGLSAKLHPGGRDTFTLEMLTGTVRASSGVVRFASNDPNENPYEFTVTGIVEERLLGSQATSISVYNVSNGTNVYNGSQLSFGSVVRNSSPPTKQLTITNRGTLDLKVGNFELPSGSGFSVTRLGTPWPAAIKPGQSVSFKIAMSTTVVGSKNAPLTIRYGDSSEFSFLINLNGNVTS
jgi:hypothetical protein